MKTRTIAASLPLLAGIVLGIVALALPFLMANHYIFVEGKKFSVDNYLFFFWGKYYTVVGTKMIQSTTTMYDFGDYPLIVMVVIALGLILSTISLFAGRGLVLNIKGRELKLKFDANPIFYQIISLILITSSYIYMTNASYVFRLMLEQNRYVTEFGPGMDVLFGSVLALSISTIMTAAKFVKSLKSRKIKNGRDKISTSSSI